jgi:hypothetical protein
MTTGKTKGEVKRPSEGRYTKDNRERENTGTRSTCIGRYRGTEKALS